jgi:hypothetical protein
MGKKVKNTRIMRANFKDGSHNDFKITRAVKLNVKDDDKRIYLESLPDGTFRLMWTAGMLDEFSELVNLEMIREDE